MKSMQSMVDAGKGVKKLSTQDGNEPGPKKHGKCVVSASKGNKPPRKTLGR